MTRSTEQVEAFFKSVLAAPAHRTFGLTLLRWTPGEAVLGFTADEACLGPSGEVHGGVVSLLLEPAATFALIPMLPADRYAVTADIHIQLPRPIRPQARVELIGRVTRLGSQLAFCEATAMDGDRVCVLARLTKAIVAAKPPSAA